MSLAGTPILELWPNADTDSRICRLATSAVALLRLGPAHLFLLPFPGWWPLGTFVFVAFARHPDTLT